MAAKVVPVAHDPGSVLSLSKAPLQGEKCTTGESHPGCPVQSLRREDWGIQGQAHLLWDLEVELAAAAPGVVCSLLPDSVRTLQAS